jgi:hypothetical protein
MGGDGTWFRGFRLRCWRGERVQIRAEMSEEKGDGLGRLGFWEACAEGGRFGTTAATDDGRRCWTSAKSRRVPSTAPIGQAHP